MAFRGRGRGRGGFGGGGGFRAAKQEPVELYPEIEDLGTAKLLVEKMKSSKENMQLIKCYSNLQKYWNSSPYYYEGGSDRTKNVQTPEVERLLDKDLQVASTKPPLWHFIKLDIDHVPAELARGENKGKRAVKRVKWNQESDLNKLDLFEKLEQKHQGLQGKENKQNEDQEEDDEGNEEEAEEEFSDEGDYEQNEYFDDDEDDFNMVDDNDDEPFF